MIRAAVILLAGAGPAALRPEASLATMPRIGPAPSTVCGEPS